jgi:hypothetical protein
LFAAVMVSTGMGLERLGGLRGMRHDAEPTHSVFNPLELLAWLDREAASHFRR